MGIVINPLTFVITIPKADLTLVQSSPTEIRELNLNTFRMWLKDWEDDDGITFLKTHDHNPEVIVGGLTLARVINILDPYTITFEDGQYAVNLVGANSNVGDRVNVNQVSVRSQNSAGMTSSPAIEYASYNGAVCVDPINGVSGTSYNIGTPGNPVNNLIDAKLIADYRGFYELQILNSITITGIDLSDFVLRGKSKVKTVLTFHSSAILNDITVENCNVQGILDGGSRIENCSVGSVTYVNGHIDNCGLYGTIQLNGNEEAVLANCYTIDQDNPCIIDMGGSGQDLSMPNYSGMVTINNLTSASEEIGIGLLAGMVTLDSTISAGTIIVAGTGLLNDNSTGTANVNTDGLMNTETITKTQWTNVYLDIDNGESGTKFPLGTLTNPVDNLADALTICTKNNISTIMLGGTLTLTQNVSFKEFISWKNGKIDLNNQISIATRFREINLYGTQHATSIILAYDCKIGNILSMQGIFDSCNFLPTTATAITIKGDTIFRHCASQKGKAFDIDMSLIPDLHLFDWAGNLKLINSTNALSEIEGIDVKGNIEIASSCTLGKFHLQGNCVITNNGSDAVEVNTDGTIATEKKLFINNKIVYLDIVNGTPGTSFPHGTIDHKSNNLTDALIILNDNNMIHLEITGAVSVLSTHDISGLTISATKSLGNSITVSSGAITNGTYFENLSVSGVMNGLVNYNTCILGDITNFDGGAKNSLITGNISITGTGANYLTDCDVYETTGAYQQINIGNKLLNIIRCRGAYELTNYTGVLAVTADLVSGRIKVASSCVSGMIVISGIVSLTDESGVGCFVRDATITQSGIVNNIWDETISEHNIDGTFGKIVDKIDKNTGLIPALL